MPHTPSGTRTCEPLIAALALGLAACRGPAAQGGPAAAQPQASARPPAASAEAASGFEGGARGRFHSKRFDLWVTLPDGKRWAIDDRRGEWLVARHAPTGSTLRVRLIREDDPLGRDRCEAHVRDLDPSVPRDTSGKLVESLDRPDLLPGYDARSFSLVVTRQARAAAGQPAPPPTLEAHQVAFAAHVRRCVAWHYTTGGPTGTEAAIGARLGEMTEMFRQLRFEDETAGPGREPRAR